MLLFYDFFGSVKKHYPCGLIQVVSTLQAACYLGEWSQFYNVPPNVESDPPSNCVSVAKRLFEIGFGRKFRRMKANNALVCYSCLRVVITMKML
jgi:hypothetical protein